MLVFSTIYQLTIQTLDPTFTTESNVWQGKGIATLVAEAGHLGAAGSRRCAFVVVVVIVGRVPTTRSSGV